MNLALTSSLRRDSQSQFSVAAVLGSIRVWYSFAIVFCHIGYLLDIFTSSVFAFFTSNCMCVAIILLKFFGL